MKIEAYQVYHALERGFFTDATPQEKEEAARVAAELNAGVSPETVAIPELRYPPNVEYSEDGMERIRTTARARLIEMARKVAGSVYPPANNS